MCYMNLCLLYNNTMCFFSSSSLHYFPLEGPLGERLFTAFDRDNDMKINANEFLSKYYLLYHALQVKI